MSKVYLFNSGLSRSYGVVVYGCVVFTSNVFIFSNKLGGSVQFRIIHRQTHIHTIISTYTNTYIYLCVLNGVSSDNIYVPLLGFCVFVLNNLLVKSHTDYNFQSKNV